MIYLVIVYSMLYLILLNSFRSRGNYFTWNFFLFIFFFLMSRSAAINFEMAWLKLPVLWEPLAVALIGNGIVFILFYISLEAAQSFQKQAVYSFKGIFPLVIFAGCFCVILAAFASRLLGSHPLGNFFRHYPFNSPAAWFYGSAHFFTAFLLINCSRFKNSVFKPLFFLLPLLNIWLYRFTTDKLFLAVEESLFLTAIIALSFFKLNYEPVQAGKK